MIRFEHNGAQLLRIHAKAVLCNRKKEFIVLVYWMTSYDISGWRIGTSDNSTMFVWIRDLGTADTGRVLPYHRRIVIQIVAQSCLSLLIVPGLGCIDQACT